MAPSVFCRLCTCLELGAPASCLIVVIDAVMESFPAITISGDVTVHKRETAMTIIGDFGEVLVEPSPARNICAFGEDCEEKAPEMNICAFGEDCEEIASLDPVGAFGGLLDEKLPKEEISAFGDHAEERRPVQNICAFGEECP